MFFIMISSVFFISSAGHEKAPRMRGFREAADGIRTHDLLHGKQTL
jgi:hypothetical protein